MPLKGATDLPCSRCGAPLVADGSTQAPLCPYCGTRNVLPDAAWQAVRPPDARPLAVAAQAAPRAALRWVVAAGMVVLLAGAGVVVAVGRSASGTRSVGVAGGPCDGAEWACSNDGRAQLRCDGNRFAVALACKGPRGCRAVDDGLSVSCDYTFADEGDPCNVDDDACSSDHRAVLHCDRSSFVVSATCKGPEGCTITPHDRGATLSCDDHIADPNDLCKGDTAACSSDRKAMLRCRRGRFVAVGACKGPGACTATKNPGADTTTVSCDGNIADVGDLCESGHACSSDGKRLLRCADGHFAFDTTCPRGCKPQGDELSCR